MAVRYYLRLGGAAERIAGILADRGIDVSGRTILRWVQSTWKGRPTQDRRLHGRMKLIPHRATYVEVGPVEMIERRQVRYIGLDVHRTRIAVAITEEPGAPTSYGNIANDPSAVRKLMTRLSGADVHLQVAYEAGPTGYTACGVSWPSWASRAWVVAPSLIPKQPANKV